MKCKFIFGIITYIVYMYISCLNCFGAEISMTNKISSASTETEINQELMQIECDIKIDDNDTGKNIIIHRYSSKVGDFVSLREMVESLGGNIIWEPDYETKTLGYINFLGSNYIYKSHYSLDEIPDIKSQFAIDIYKLDGDKKILVPMSNGVESMYTKFIDGKIYMRFSSLRYLMPRSGYIFNVDEKNSSFNIKNYNFNSEKDLLLTKFPVSKFGKSLYGNTDTDYYPIFGKNMYYCGDVFAQQVSDTENMEKNYFNYIDTNFRRCYVQDNEDFYKNLFQANYRKFIDNIYIEYDNDLDSYIIYNKNFNDVDEIDNTYKIMVIRKFDNMILYKN